MDNIHAVELEVVQIHVHWRRICLEEKFIWREYKAVRLLTVNNGSSSNIFIHISNYFTNLIVFFMHIIQALDCSLAMLNLILSVPAFICLEFFINISSSIMNVTSFFDSKLDHLCPLKCYEYIRQSGIKCQNLSSLFKIPQSKNNYMECNCENSCVWAWWCMVGSLLLTAQNPRSCLLAPSNVRWGRE